MTLPQAGRVRLAARRRERLAPAKRERRNRRILRFVLGSAALHLALLLFLIITIHRRATVEPLPPPGIAMVFEAGSKEGPRLPNPTLEANPPPVPPATPPAASQPPPAPQPSPVPGAAPAPPPAAPAAPAPEVKAAPPPTAARSAPAQAPRAASPPALPSTPPSQDALAEATVRPFPPPEPAPAEASPAPPERQAMVMPPPPAEPLRPPQPMPRPSPAPAQPGKPGGAKSGRTGPPIHLFANSLPSLSKFALGPAEKGPTSIMPFARISSAALGEDWRNELAAWIEAHKYYPEDAARRGEEGINQVRIVVNRSGHVESVELVRPSGYRSLDTAAVALFRDADLPPFPLGTPQERVTVDLTIHYIIIRN